MSHSHDHDHSHDHGVTQKHRSIGGHGTSHSHGGHSHAPKSFGTAFAIGAALNITYVVLEATFGLLSGSLALLADAGHNLSDGLGLILAGGAIWLAAKPPKGNRTYGFKRTPILAALANALILLVAVGAIGWEAIRRFYEPEQVATSTVIRVAIVGVFVNGITAWLFASGAKNDINVRGAFIHMVADASVTVGVIIAALGIRFTGWLWLDPAISLVIDIVIFAGTWSLLRDSVTLAIDAVPPGIDLDAVKAYLRTAQGVEEVHDLHVWGMSTTETALSAHLVCASHEQGQRLLEVLSADLHDRFGIGHATLQVETAQVAQHCRLRPDHVV